MSGVQKAIGSAVEFVMREQATRCAGEVGAWMTVGQVAEACEISKPTARKYMHMLVASGTVQKSLPVDVIGTICYLWSGE